MAESFESGALLGHVYRLRGGTCVRLRLARDSDARAIRHLLARDGAGPAQGEVLQLVRFDPRRSYVVCATALVDSREMLLGVGVIAVDGDHPAEPSLLVLADGYSDELAPLLTRALAGTAAAARRRRAA